jgi:REP element-mobilizing transposase RayT
MTPRKRLNHETPHWVTSDADYFVTLCAEPRRQNHFCKDPVGQAILDSIRIYNEKQNWFCDLAVLMPDHIHLLVSFPPEKILSQVVGLWKRALAKTAPDWSKHGGTGPTCGCLITELRRWDSGGYL